MTHAKALSAIDRQNQIIELLVTEHGSVQVDDLVKMLGVSKMTVHRDLDALEVDGRLRKVHGGATLADVAQSNECTFCHGTIPPDSRSKVTLHMADGTQQSRVLRALRVAGAAGIGGGRRFSARDRLLVRARRQCAIGHLRCEPRLWTSAVRRLRWRFRRKSMPSGFNGDLAGRS